MSPETKKSVDRIEKNYERGIIDEDARQAMLYELYVDKQLTDDEHFVLCDPMREATEEPRS